jgi:glycosyltransferase involved in cell wall biosynthesis
MADLAPRVSVVVTTYNQADWIGLTVRSALAQTRPADEVVVVDDGSTDDTPARLAALGDRITVVRQRNGGVAAARNAGVARARGELIAFLDGDDLWEPEVLAAHAEAHRASPGAGLIALDGVRFSGDEVLVPTLLRNAPPSTFAADGGALATAPCYADLVRGNFIATTSQIAVPAAVLAAVGPSDTRLPVSSDYDLYLRIAARYPIAVLRRPLVRCRYLASSASGPEAERPLRWGLDVVRILGRERGRAPAGARALVAEMFDRRLRALAADAAGYGRAVDRARATRYLARLLRVAPAHPAVARALLRLWWPRRPVAALARVLGRRADR